jgi:general secretion pathway protein L
MSDQLFILFHDTNLDSIEWIYYKKKQFGKVVSNSIDRLKAGAKSVSVTVILPLKDVSYFSIDLSIQNEKNLRKALPYALEDNIVAPVEDLFFALENKHNVNRGVWVINHQRFQAYLDCLKELSIEALHIVPAMALMKNPEFDYSLWLYEEEATLSGKVGTFTFDSINLEIVFDALLGEDNYAQYSCEIVNFGDNFQENSFNAPTHSKLDFTLNHFDKGQFLTALSTRFLEQHPHSPVNLLQGQYDTSIDILEILKKWKWAGILSTLILCFFVVTTMLENAKLSKQLDKLTADINYQYLKAFPKIKKPSKAKAKMVQVLSTLDDGKSRGANKLSIALSEVGKALLLAKDVSIDKVEYTKPNITLTLNTETVDAIDNTFSQLSKLDYEVKVVSVSNKSDSVVGLIKVTLQ